MGSSSAQYGVTGRWVRSKKITEAMTNATTAILEVPAKTLIPPKGVVIVITTAFEGGSPLLDIGDGDNADGWIDQTDITAGTAGTYSGDETSTAYYIDNGRYYSAADTIDVVASSGLTTGVAYVFAYMIDVSDIIDD